MQNNNGTDNVVYYNSTIVAYVSLQATHVRTRRVTTCTCDYKLPWINSHANIHYNLVCLNLVFADSYFSCF